MKKKKKYCNQQSAGFKFKNFLNLRLKVKCSENKEYETVVEFENGQESTKHPALWVVGMVFSILIFHDHNRKKRTRKK